MAGFLDDGTDLHALARAVARHETASCTLGTGYTHNNCFGIKRLDGKFRWYPSNESSFSAKFGFYDTWRRLYGRFPDHKLADRWTGKDRTNIWLANVKAFYNEYK